MACYVSRAMTENPSPESLLAAAGLPAQEVRDWLRARPGAMTSFEEDRARFAPFFARGAALLERLQRFP